MYILVSPSRYYILPLVGGIAWFLTLSILLIYWLAEGRPVYPSQINPYIAFISDIGAHRLKPVFFVGCTVTAIAYAATIFAAHHVRSDPRMYGIRDPLWRRVVSALALIAGVAASVGCVCMSVFDTRWAKELHRPMLTMTFAGIALSALCTEIVYSDQMRRSAGYKRLRPYCLISLGIFLSEVILSAAFWGFSWTDHERTGGILEWVVAFVGTFYILTFVGFVSQQLHYSDKNGMEIVGGVSAVLAVVASVATVSKKLNEVRDSYSSVALNIQLAAIQLATIRDALEDIATWRLKVQSETKAARKLDAALADSLKGCAVLITVIDSKLGEAGYEPGFKGKISHLWLEDVLKGYISNLDGQVRALQLLLTSNQMSTLADVMHHLEKAEARAVFEQVRADTASLTVGNKDLEDAVSVISGYTPSVNFEMDDILMDHPAYQAAYGKRRRAPLRPRSSQDQLRKKQSPSPTRAEARVLDKPHHVPPNDTIDTMSVPAGDVPSKSQTEEPLVSPGNKPQAEESSNTISPSDTYSHFSPSLAPAPLAISKTTQGRTIQEEGDASLVSAVESFKDQIHSAFDDRPQGQQQQDHDIQLHGPQSDGDSFDRDEMISLLPVASHFDISRKPKDRNRHSHRPSISSRDNDKRTIRADDSKSASSFKSGRPSLSGPPESSPPLQGGDASGEASAVKSVAQNRADEESRKSPKRISRSGSRREDGNGSVSRMPSARSIKRPPSTDSDLYTSSLTDRHGTKPQSLGRSSSIGSQQSVKSSNKRKSRHTSTHQDGLDQVKTSDPTYDEALPRSRTESIGFNLPLVESPAARDITRSPAEANAEDSTAPSTANQPQRVSQTAPAILPPTQRSSIHMGSTQHPNAPHVRPRSSTAQVSRASPPFRKPVPSNSLRRSELSSPDFVRYSTDQHHGLKIVLTPESDPKQRHMSTPPLAPPPPPPTRPPPSVPTAHNPLATLSPTTSLDITRRWSNESSPSRYMMTGGLASPVERDESINETLSTVSSSDRSDAQTLSSAMTSTTNTVATSQPADSIRSQAQNDLQKLQQQLSEAKVRGDSTAQKASLQQSMEIIKKAYLSQSTASNLNHDGTSTAKPKAIRKKSSSLLTMVGKKSKNAELLKAARIGDNDTLRSLLEDRANPNMKGESGRTPLMEAATRNHLHCMQTLKEFGADEFAIDGGVNSSGQNALHLAVSAEQPKAVSWLIEAYPPTAPDVPGKKSSRLAWATEAITGSRSSKILQESSDGNGQRPLHVAADSGSVSMVSLLLDLGSDIEAKDNWARSPLINAAKQNQIEVVSLLLKRGADVSPEDVDGMTALHWSAKNNHLGVLRTLLSSGHARVKNRSWPQSCYNRIGDLPIHSASRNGHIEPMKLLKGDRPMSELRTKHGETLLHIAALHNQLELAQELFRDTIDVNTWAKPHSYHLRLWPNDETEYNSKALPLPYNIIPLHYACTRGYFEMTTMLIEKGAWVNAAPDDDDHGLSPLMMAVECGNTNLVCLLLARGAKATATVPATLFTALHFACKRGNVETSQELVRYGAKTAARTKDLRTPEELVQKVKDTKKRLAMEKYFAELSRQRLAKIKAQMAENRPNGLPPQPTPSPQPPQQITYVYPPGTVVYPPNAVIPGTAMPAEFMDHANDAYPEAPPAYTPGANAPRHMANRPGVNRPHFG
ncbi:MAG: hypothetical protein Q9215_008010 [Flavoplaca cf. flavocitrina]